MVTLTNNSSFVSPYFAYLASFVTPCMSSCCFINLASIYAVRIKLGMHTVNLYLNFNPVFSVADFNRYLFSEIVYSVVLIVADLH